MLPIPAFTAFRLANGFRFGVVKKIMRPAPASVKFFGASEVLELAKDRGWLAGSQMQ